MAPLSLARPGRAALRLALASLTLALLLPAAADAHGVRGTSAAARKTRAFEMCRDELARREGARDVRAEQVLRNEHRDDRVYLDADMVVRRGERSYTRRVACVVEFQGENRIVGFDVSGGGSGGGGDPATRACWDAAEEAGFEVRDADEPRRLEDGARLVTMDAGRGGELLCLYQRGVRGIYQRRR